MKPDDLESLLLDRALGELSPVVAELLEEHLARDQAAARQAAVLTATVQAARQAMILPAPRLPLEGIDRLNRALRQQRRRARLIEIAKLAACVLLGLGLGRLLSPVPPAPPGPLIADTRNVSVPEPPASIPTKTRFWSVSNLASERRSIPARPERRGAGYQVHWKSPYSLPRLEEEP